jgi:hypothetical protein
MQLSPESTQTIGDILQQNPDTSDMELQQLMQAGMTPKYPVVTNPEEKDLSKVVLKPKMKINETGDVADLYLVPEDLEGDYDYIADVRSMASGADQELIQGRTNALQILTTNANVLQLLQQEGYRPKIKELLGQSFEDLGLKDSDRFFEKLTPALNGQATIPGQPPISPTQTGNPQMGGLPTNSPIPGLPAVPQAPPPTGIY